MGHLWLDSNNHPNDGTRYQDISQISSPRQME
jgi:hypothetical protein